MPGSNRRKFFNMDEKVEPGTVLFEIIDPHFQPDLRGEFSGGHKIVNVDGRQCVRITEAQAKFFLDQGSLAKVAVAGATGASGASGASGATSSSGTSGASGATSSSGTSGASGAT